MVDETHPVRAELVDEILSAEPTVDIQEEAQEDIIGPRHPTLFSSNIDRTNILPFRQRPRVLVTSANDCPRAYKKALTSVDKNLWELAIKKELQSMNDLSVWDVIDLNPDYKLVETTWVFRIKRNHLNEITEHKACLCAQGFTLTPGLDFNKTYSPKGRFNSLCTLIAFATLRCLEFHQVDIKSAFLNATLTETVYLSIPQGLDFNQI
ncbi:hypothetical protein O181_082891 [Austropuccinia psidii MF-1]|uniref:Reverse transcriptase Ty1/copia-type domain-containing protein n=1 Tax=Austropuccinia psidii MF-1 TaxID=1389203 RepID=A0A9Q3IHE5_9BASI|nr:hypothetical protein [Austropuccinia psidii MF-1]